MDYHSYMDHMESLQDLDLEDQFDRLLMEGDRLDHLKDHFIGLIEDVYSFSELNLEKFERHLDEIASVLDMQLPYGKPNLERKDNNDIYNFGTPFPIERKLI